MGFMNDYHPEAMKPTQVPCEGDYLCMVLGAEHGRMQDGKQYIRVVIKVKCDGEPRTSLFLTEGESFDKKATAFFDTFDIQRNNWNFEQWKAKKGMLHIKNEVKNGYAGMACTYITNSDGWCNGKDFCNPSKGDDNPTYGGTSDFPDDIPF